MEQYASAFLSSRPQVLVADADKVARAAYGYALMAMGFDVTMVEHAAKARTRASRMHPDIIMVAVGPKVGDGWTVVRNLKRDSRTRDIPVVIITADDASSVRGRAERAGCAALCLKSCPPDKLASGLRSVLKRRSRRIAHVSSRRVAYTE